MPSGRRFSDKEKNVILAYAKLTTQGEAAKKYGVSTMSILRWKKGEGYGKKTSYAYDKLDRIVQKLREAIKELR